MGRERKQFTLTELDFMERSMKENLRIVKKLKQLLPLKKVVKKSRLTLVKK